MPSPYYEYDTLLFQEHRGAAVLDRLNELARDGWRVVGIMRSTYILERKVVPEAMFRGKRLSTLSTEEMGEYAEAMTAHLEIRLPHRPVRPEPPEPDDA